MESVCLIGRIPGVSILGATASVYVSAYRDYYKEGSEIVYVSIRKETKWLDN